MDMHLAPSTKEPMLPFPKDTNRPTAGHAAGGTRPAFVPPQGQPKNAAVNVPGVNEGVILLSVHHNSNLRRFVYALNLRLFNSVKELEIHIKETYITLYKMRGLRAPDNLKFVYSSKLLEGDKYTTEKAMGLPWSDFCQLIRYVVTGALKSAGDEDEDGFIHVTYRGEENARGSINHEQEGMQKRLQELSQSLTQPNETTIIPNMAENSVDAEYARGNFAISRPIVVLEPWKARGWGGMYDKLQETVMKENAEAWFEERPGIPGKEIAMRKIELYCKRFKHKLRTCPEVGQLREKRPSYVPVIVKKDERSDISDIDYEKMLVHGELPLGEFVYFIRARIGWLNIDNINKPIFVSFKNTEPPVGALMSEVDVENKGEDGFLHVTYSGEVNAPESINHEQEWREKTMPGPDLLLRRGRGLAGKTMREFSQSLIRLHA